MSRTSGPHPTCVGICRQYQALKPSSGKRYDLGQKRCQGCEQWVLFEGTFCPCCNHRLRTSPKNRKSKINLFRIE